MVHRTTTNDTGLGVTFIFSTVIHLAVFLLLMWWGKLVPIKPVAETYFVDVVNLPVAAPQAGQPSQKGNSEPAPPPVQQRHEMVVPKPMTVPSSKPAKVAPPKHANPEKPRPAVDTESQSFTEKMAKLQSKTEAQQQEDALARLRNKVKSGTGRAGMPAATGKEAGSDYSAYLQSRLKEAFKETISYTSKNPEVVIRLFIDSNGKLSRSPKTERSSGDRAFEISVIRAIDLASEKFPPPPNRKSFEGVFVFKPQGITNKP